jgi:hypothetical protein
MKRIELSEPEKQEQWQTIWRDFHDGWDFSSWTLVDLGLLSPDWMADDRTEDEKEEDAKMFAQLEDLEP